MSRSTTRFRITSTARNRITPTLASPAARTGARSGRLIGSGRRRRMRIRRSRSARLAHHLFKQRRLRLPLRQDEGGRDQDISPVPIDNSGHGAADLIHRFQWVSPLMLSPHNPDTIYTAAECVFRSTDQGQSWTQISKDLTRNDKDEAAGQWRSANEGHHLGRILRHHFRPRGIAA